MFRRFRHRLFLLLQTGILLSGGLAFVIWRDHWRPVLVCVAGALVSALICERLARDYLRKTVGSLRRAADDIGRGRRMALLETQPGDDMHKLVSAVNLLATRLADAGDEERRLQEQLRRRERLAFLGELAASVAHEVNNPLDGIQNCSRILRRSLDDREKAGQMLELMDSGLTRIELIVRRLLTLAREHVVRPSEVNLREVVCAAIDSVKARLEGQNVRIETAWTAHDDRAAVDPVLLEHTFANLLLNAVDSMPEGGTIRVRLGRIDDGSTGDVLQVEIEDEGVGVPPELLPRLFEPFVTTKRDGKGTGLGLAIASRIIDAHDGSISVRPRVGGGTVFAIQLPACAIRGDEVARSATDVPVLQTPGAKNG